MLSGGDAAPTGEAMDLLFFGRLAEIAGSRGGEVDLPATVTTVGEVRAWLLRERPRVGEAIAAPGVFAVADNVVVRDDAPLAGVRQLAFMPPVSGG